LAAGGGIYLSVTIHEISHRSARSGAGKSVGVPDAVGIVHGERKGGNGSSPIDLLGLQSLKATEVCCRRID